MLNIHLYIFQNGSINKKAGYDEKDKPKARGKSFRHF